MTDLVLLPDGPRLSLLYTTPAGPSEVVGTLLDETDTELVVLPEDGPALTIRSQDITARREVPPRPVRPSSSSARLQRLMAQGWAGLEQHRLGGWLLRAGAGFTHRANSALPIGDPGSDTGTAIDRVVAYYRERGIEPAIQIFEQSAGEAPDTTLAALDDRLLAEGWVPRVPADVYVRDLRSRPAQSDIDLGDPLGPVDLRWADAPDAQWLGVYRGGGVPEAGRAVLTSSPAAYLTVLVEDQVAAVGRAGPTADWVGLAAIEVAEDFRRLGLGRLVTEALLGRYAARFAYLQVETTNEPAQRLYAAQGFAFHHRYHYRVLPT